MAFLLLDPAVLPRLAETSLTTAVPPLKVKDHRDHYCTSDGDGLWIRPFLEFLEAEVAHRCHLRAFQFSTDDSVDEEVLKEIPQPPMLCASGPSGSGKGETIRLAASFLGEDAVKVQPCDDPEVFMRNIGMLLAASHRFVVFDEFSKTPSLLKKLGAVLQIGSIVSWRPLYQNHRVQTPCRGAFYFPCVRFPDFLADSPEFLRRTRHIRLHRKTPNWAVTAGGDTADWRDNSIENATAANSLLTHVWRCCYEFKFHFN